MNINGIKPKYILTLQFLFFLRIPFLLRMALQIILNDASESSVSNSSEFLCGTECRHLFCCWLIQWDSHHRTYGCRAGWPQECSWFHSRRSKLSDLLWILRSFHWGLRCPFSFFIIINASSPIIPLSFIILLVFTAITTASFWLILHLSCWSLHLFCWKGWIPDLWFRWVQLCWRLAAKFHEGDWVRLWYSCRSSYLREKCRWYSDRLSLFCRFPYWWGSVFHLIACHWCRYHILYSCRWAPWMYLTSNL